MRKSWRKWVAGGVLVGLLTDCGDPPEQIRLRNEQEAEILRMERQLAELRERVKDAPKEPMEEEEELGEELKRLEARVVELEDETQRLREKRKEAEEILKEYRTKYVAE